MKRIKPARSNLFSAVNDKVLAYAGIFVLVVIVFTLAGGEYRGITKDLTSEQKSPSQRGASTEITEQHVDEVLQLRAIASNEPDSAYKVIFINTVNESFFDKELTYAEYEKIKEAFDQMQFHSN